ncbi:MULTISPECIES: TIGR00730 family Rossman fold protein [unclassified Streptococcus]|uniref:LOG family protein n=1 Tax=unclassified Streptococcus TaxID=2608887 RepID=UPI00359E35B0
MNITVYCGASSGDSPIYQKKTVALADWLTDKGHRLVYGGGNVGLMGFLADRILTNGGQVIGVMPSFLQKREIAHPNLTELIVVPDMPSRKAKMIALGDAFIALPGGPGTLEEITEVISWSRIGQNDGPCILYNVTGYFNPLKAMYDHMVAEGFLSQTDRDKILFSDNLEEIEAFITTYKAPDIREYTTENKETP